MSVEPRRPRLLAQNRKLRHLHGLSLRNLSFAPPKLLRAADDSDLIVQKNAHKLDPLGEAGGPLHSSRSSGNLRRDSLHSAADNNSSSRPQQQRRTSLSLAQWNLGARQKKLEEVVDTAVGDVFFTLHVAGETEPVYISEVKEKSANFDFQFFNLASSSSDVSRTCRLIVRVWLKRSKQDSWSFLLEEFIDLRQLHFIGSLIDRRYPPNSLLIHLEDGVYSLDFPTKAAEPRQAPPIATSSYSALMKLANLEISIQDAIETRRVILQQINNLVEQTPTSTADMAVEQVSLADKYLASQRRVNRQAERRRDELRESLKSRRLAISQGREAQVKAEQDIAADREKLSLSAQRTVQMDVDIRGQRRRICSELSEVFPITPIPNAPPLSFEICGVNLPNSVYDHTTARTLSEDSLSAGLGLVALVTRHLQFYLSHPLPYNIVHYGSRSYIQDEISHLDDKSVGGREFPLFLPRGGSTSGQWRFEYGWFLLNKDIEALCSSQGLRVVDIRHTLANLKYLLYVCSAGSDEMPERKKGGVRGLWAGRIKGRLPPGLVDGDGSSASSSRPGSADSEATNTTQRGDTLKKSAWQERMPVSFDDGASFSFRTKGLRENVAG